MREKRFLQMEEILRRYNDSLKAGKTLPEPQFYKEELLAFRHWQQERINNDEI